jgi:hypothetical protein
MTTLLLYLWQKMASMQLAIALCLLLTADLALGYFCLIRQTAMFTSLNDMGLLAWMSTYGRYNLLLTGWFFILLLLLTLLACNTFACTTQRLIVLFGTRHKSIQHTFLVKLAPHLMHYALIIILVGYLGSYLFAEVESGRTLVPGASMTLTDTRTKVTFVDFQPVYYQGDRLDFFKGEVIEPKAHMLLVDDVSSTEAILSCNQPLHFHGYSLYLEDFFPKSMSGGMKMTVRIDLQIRKDPGVTMYFAGMLLFSLGLVLYIYEWMFFRKGNTSCA